MARVVKEAEVRREELLELALRLFMTDGYEGTSVDRITRSAGVAKGTFYHYFVSKEDLLEQLVESYADDLFAHLDAQLATIDGSAVDRLLGFSRLATSWKLEHREESAAFGRMLYAEGNLALRHKLFSAWLERTRPTLASIIEQGVAEGTLAVADASASAGVALSIWYDWGDRIAERVYLPEFDREAALLAAADLRAGFLALDRILGLPEGTMGLPDEVDVEEMLLGLAGSVANEGT